MLAHGPTCLQNDVPDCLGWNLQRWMFSPQAFRGGLEGSLLRFQFIIGRDFRLKRRIAPDLKIPDRILNMGKNQPVFPNAR